MAEFDELDKLIISGKLTKDDYSSFSEILGIEISDSRESLNIAIRHRAYGHAIANIGRSYHYPDYIEILRATATKLGVKWKVHSSLEEIENNILIEVMDIARENIIKEKGEEAWKEIERNAEKEINKLIESGKIDKKFAEELKNVRAGGAMAMLFAGKLAGFGLYIVANQLFFAIARQLGLKIGFAVAGPIIGKTLAFLLGPAGWILAGIWMIFDLGDTNWKKTITSVVLVISIRQRIKYES